MNVAALRETELLSRTIAKWSSVAAAVVFGVAFVTDRTLTWEVISDQYVHIVLVLAIFVGYALAWTKRSEVLGSTIVLTSIVTLYAYCLIVESVAISAIFLAVGLPALFHLVAVGLQRFARPRVARH